MADPDDQWAELLRVVDRGPDRMKQVEDRDEIRCLFECLPARTSKLLWEHYGLGIPLPLLAHREGVTLARISEILCEAKRRIRESSDYLLTG